MGSLPPAEDSETLTGDARRLQDCSAALGQGLREFYWREICLSIVFDFDVCIVTAVYG